MRARTRSILHSTAPIAFLGTVALAARYLPDCIFPPTAAAEPALAAPSAPSPGAAPPAVAPPAAASPSLPVSRAARYDADPEARAACPVDMALVDGDFCPALPYDCARPTGAVGCAEYVRDRRCQEAPERRRYCIDR